MRNYAILILSLIVFSESLFPEGSEELAKVPALIQHYRQHKIFNPSLDFSAFLALHYDNPEHHQSNHSEHDQLPCSHHASCTQCNCAFIVFGHPLWSVIQHVILEQAATPYHAPAEFKICTNIWQPPRI